MGLTELASSSFGQTFNVTPIQMITAVSAAVNGGYLVTPHLVSKIVDSSGNTVKSMNNTVNRQVISSETSNLLRTLMEAVVDGGGGKNAYVSGYRIGGKTGTSQKVSKMLETGESGLYIASFCGVAPINDPEIAVLVMLDEPHGDAYYRRYHSRPCRRSDTVRDTAVSRSRPQIQRRGACLNGGKNTVCHRSEH